MAELVKYDLYEEPNNWLWAGYAFALIAVLAYLFSEFLLLPLPMIIALFVLGILMLIVGYGSKAKRQKASETKKTMFRRREM